MALKAVLTAEEYEAVDEALRSHYTAAADGKYYLDAEGVDALPAVRGLSATLKKYREVAPDANALRKRVEEVTAIREVVGDLDADGLRAALDRLRELEEGDGKKSADLQQQIQSVKDALTKQHAKVIEEKDAEIQRLTAHIEDREIDQAIAEGLEKAEVIPATRAAVKAFLKLRGPKVVWEDGKPRGVFVGELGDEIDIPTYVQAWAKTDEAKPFLPPSGNEGIGAKNGLNGKAHVGNNPWKSETFNLTEQARITRENPALAKQLAAAAGRQLMLSA